METGGQPAPAWLTSPPSSTEKPLLAHVLAKSAGRRWPPGRSSLTPAIAAEARISAALGNKFTSCSCDIGDDGAGGRVFRDIFRRWPPRVCLGVRVTSTPQSQRKGSARVVRGLWTAGPGLGHMAPPGATGVGKCHGPCSQPHPTGASSTGTITGAVSDGRRGLREDRACGAHDGAGTPSCGCNPRTRQSKAYNRGIFYFKDHENEVSTAGPATQSWKQNLADGFESPPYPRPEPPVCPQPLLSFRCPENPELGAGAGFPALRQWRRAARLPRVVSLLQVVPGVQHVFTRLRSVDLHGGRCLSTPQLPHPSPWGATAGQSRFWQSKLP